MFDDNDEENGSFILEAGDLDLVVYIFFVFFDLGLNLLFCSWGLYKLFSLDVGLLYED